MELPSKRIQKELKGKSMSTIKYHNQLWFDKYYMSRIDDVPEQRRGRLLEPGKIYNYLYDAKYKNELDFWDKCVMVMVIGHVVTKSGKLNVLGINLSFIPPQYRVKILDKIVKVFNTQVVEPNVKRIQKGKVHGSLKKMPLYYDVCKRILAQSGFEFAIRSYIYRRIKSEPLIITYEDWWRPATFASKYIVKMNIRAIYALYKKNLSEGYRIGKPDPKIEIMKTKIMELEKYLKVRGKKKR